MNKQFIRFYLFLLLSVFSLLYGISLLHDQLVEPDSYQVAVPALLDAAAQGDAPLFRPVDPRDIHFPAELRNKLAAGEVLALRDDRQQLMYYSQQQGQLYAFGPVLDKHPPEQALNHYFAAGFYSLLALSVLVLLYPIGRDILRMRQAAQAFAAQPAPLNLQLSSNSILSPLANSMNSMSARIAQLLRLQQDLANTVAHEVRTPLARMTFVLQRLESTLDSVTMNRLQRDIDEINQLVTDYLEFVRSQDDQLLKGLAWQNPQPILADIKDKFEAAGSRSDVQLIVSTDETRAFFDARFMQIAIENLVVNALKYARNQVQIKWAIQQGWNEIRIEDDGVGLTGKTDAMRKAFVRQAKDTQDLGYGLGLYIAHQIAHRHQGDLLVGDRSQLGGALMIIRWPNDASIAAAQSADTTH